MAEDIRLSVGADTTQMESQIANAARKATVVIRPTIDSKGLEKISAPLGRITGQADEFSKSMEAANARVLAFGASVGVLNAVAKSFQNIVIASTQVEASLKEIQVATGETSGNLERLGKGIFEVARSTGLSFKQASEATLEFARQGGTLEDSLMKAKAALVLTRTTGLDAAEAVKGLTAAVLSFNQVGLDYETVVNKLAAVDTKFAVSSRDLIEGISRSASVAQEAGVSFDELTALITTLQEKTARGGAVIGNALKTIFQRVQTTENLDYIRNLGIAVNDVSGDILPATTIIKKLADEFQNLDSATRKGLLIKIGGGFQIDKLAALLNDISNANGTFNRSLEQSSNAGNQGFKKLDELNKTVQASFDRLTTSGTQFAATIGKVAFSDDFRSILNKTSSFLESLNESISGGEEGGATIGKSIVKGIGSVITGPGALLIAGLGIKLFGDLAKFGVDSLKNQLGVTNVKKEQQDIEKSILGLLLQNNAVQTKILSLEGNKAAQAEYLLSLYSKQAATLEKMSKLSKEVGPAVYEGGIRLTTEGTKNVKTKTAAGGYMSKDAARKMEMREAPAGASIKEISNFNFGPKEGRGTMIVNSMESVYKTPMGDFVVPSYSKTRTGKPTLFSASGYVPNFADVQKSLDIDANAYSFAGLTIGGTGLKTVRGKQLNPQLLSEVKDPALLEALSKYSKLNFKNVSVGNIYRRRDQNLDSLQASEEDIKNHFLKKANDALSPQIGTFIKDELSSLGIKPTATMQLMMKNGRKFDFVNDSMAGTFFETMLKMANMSAEDDNFGQFFNDSNSRFDIYGLKPDIAEQYGLPKKFWEYVEIKSSEKALNDELGTKFIQQLSQSGGESLKAKLLNQAKSQVQEKAKTASKGYVPNFAIRGLASNIEVLAGRVFEGLLRDDLYLDLTENNISPDIDRGYYKTAEAKMSVAAALKDANFGEGKGKGNAVIVPKDSSTENDELLKKKKGSKIRRPQSDKFLRGNIFGIARKILERESKNKKTDYSKIKMAASGYVPNFAITELKNAPVMTIGDRVKGATIEQLKSRLGGDESYTTDLAGTKINQSLDIEKIKNDVAASILGPNYHLLGNDGNLDKAYYAKLMSAFTSYKTGKTNKTAFGQMPEVKSDENRAVTGEVSGFARELKYEKLGQIFDIIAKNRNMQDVWAQIFQTKAGAGARSINSPDEQSKISKLVTQFRPVVIDELTKRLKTKVSAIMTTIGRDDAEFLALGKSVNIDEDGNLLLPDKLKVDQLQQERRFVMPLQTPENLKRVGKSKLDRIVLNDPKKRPSEGEDSTFYKTKFNASDVLSIIAKSEYPYPSYATKKEDGYGNIKTGFVTGWKGEYGIENKLNKLAEKNPFLARKIKSNFKYDKVKAKMVVANAAEFENLRTILETLRDFGVSDWDNINFEKSLQTYAPTKTAAEGFIPNFSDTKQLMGKGVGMLYEDPNFAEVGSGQSGKFLIPKSKDELGQKIFYKPGAEKIAQEYNVNQALKQFEKQNSSLFKQNAISFTDVGKLLTYPKTNDETKLAGFEREVVGGSGVDEFVTQALSKKPQEQMFAFGLSEAMAQKAAGNILKAYKQKYGPDSIRLYDIYAGNFKVNEVMQKFLIQKTKELFKGGDPYAEVLKLNVEEFNRIAGSKGGLHTMYDTMGSTNVGKTAAVGYVPNFASGDVDGDGTVTRNDPFIKRLMENAKKFSPVAKELTNNIIGNLLNMPEGIDLFEIIDQLKLVMKAQEPVDELNRIKREARLKRKNEKREEFLKRYKGTPEGSASRGYIPNFSKEAILDAIGREQKESGLPLSAIKVVQDARVRGPQNPDGYAVINNRDEPDGRVPNFASGGLDPNVLNAIEESLDGLKNLKDSSLNLNDAFKRIADNLGVSGEAVVQVFDKMTSSGSDVVQSTQQVTESNKENTDQSNKDAQGKKGANEKETKTTQDALYNLVKFQTALSFATGAMSSFGKSGEKIAEILNGAGQSLYLFSQAKDLGTSIAGEGGISGRFEAGKKAAQAAKESGGSLGSQAGAFLKGGGGMAAVGFITAGAGYAVAAYEGIKAVDSAMQIWNGTVAKSEKFIEDLTTASEKYNIQLTEQQKKTVSKISEGAAGGTDIASKLSMLYGKIVENEDFKTFGNLKELVNSTNLTADAQKALLEKLGNVIAPQATQQLTTEGNQNPTNTEIQSKSIEMLVERLTELQKQATYEIKTPEIKQAAVEAKGRLSDKYDRLASIDQDIKNNKLDLISNVDLEKERKKLLEDIKREEDFINQNTKEKVTLKLNEVEYAKLITEYIKQQVAPAQQAAYAESVRQEAMLVSANFLKEELDIQTKLKQLELNRITPRENMLSIEKDLLSTTEARRSSIDLELKQLEEQRRLQSEIKAITTTKGRETLDKYLGMTGSSLTEPRRAELKGGFQKIIDANSLKESNQAIKEFNDLLIPIRKNSEEQTREIEKQLSLTQSQIAAAEEYGNFNGKTAEELKNQLSTEKEKLQTIGASNIVLETMLNIMGQQIDYAKKATQEKLRQNAIDSLNQAVTKQQNFYINNQRDVLKAQLALKDQALQKERERLGYLREIEDAEITISRIGKDTPKDKFQQQLQDVDLQASRRKKDLRDSNQEIINANRSKIVDRLLDRPETFSLAKEAMNAKTDDELASVLEKALNIDEQGFKSTVVSAAEEFKKIIIGTAEEKTGKTAPVENPISTAKKKAETAGSKRYYSSPSPAQNASESFEAQSRAFIQESDKINQEIDEKRQELYTATKEGKSDLMFELEEEIYNLENALDDIAEKFDSLAFPPALENSKRPTGKELLPLYTAPTKDLAKGDEAIDKNADAQKRTLIFAERSRTEFGLGMKESLRGLNTDIEQFGNTLGKQIPMDFRNGLVDAMKALSDPNATTSLKERLMGVAGAFLNKINEAFMMQTANQITRGIFGNGTGAGITEGGGLLRMASGGKIEGGSGVKDDVPAMLMGGEYVIRKDVVNKYGKGFFEKLNSGKLKGFASGGTVTPYGMQETDLNDLIRNPNKYTAYGENRMAGLSFDQSGKVTGIDNYQGKEEDKQDALLKAQTNFYSQNQQTGQNGFFAPGSYGQGAIIGQKNLLSFATQETIGTQYDKMSSSGSSASIDIAGGSGNLSLFALRDQGNVRNAQYLESKNKALDLYFQDYQTSKDKIRMDFENEKEYKRQMEEWEKAKKEAKKQAQRAMVTQLATMAIMAGVSYAGSAMSKGVSATKQAAALQGRTATVGEKFKGAFTGGSFGGESRGGLANIFNSSATKDFSTIGAGALGKQGGGLYSWNNKTNSYSMMNMDTYNAQFPLGASYDKLGTPTALTSGTYFDSFYGRNRSVYNGKTAPMAIPMAMPVARRAAGGYVAGNGMGDNVPAMLNGGEFVVSKEAAQKTGYGALQKLNSTGATGGDSGEMTSRIEAKLEELVEKIAGVGTINISVNSDGKGGEKESQSDSKQDQQNKELARRIKEVVLSVLRDEKRLGGMLR
jgi:TP901 family phage tail tape measure protein